MTRLITWFAGNPVAANLLMLFLLIGGGLTLPILRQESFPEIPTEFVNVSVLYAGASPEEVEESICVKIEEEVQAIEGVDRLTSRASEGIGSVTIEIEDGADLQEILDEVKLAVDGIDSFPEDAEEPLIQELDIEERVAGVMVSGALDELALRRLADRLRDELVLRPEISRAELVNARPYEISIEVDETALRRHGLTLEAVAAAVRRSSLNLPAGSVRTASGEIVFRSAAQAYDERAFARIPLLTRPDGTQLAVGDVARVVLGFAETDQASTFDGEPALLIEVFRVGSEQTPAVARAVREFVAEHQAQLPAGVHLTVWRDHSRILAERLDLLARNGRMGLLLVFAALALFLAPRLALWVAIGLTTAVFGAIWALPLFDQSLNLLSSFGFILVLGILVDDAIVVSENIDHHQRHGMPAAQAAIRGTLEVMVPVSLAVLTTAIAFSPMLGLPGRTGAFASAIAVVVIIAIFFSLVESLLILPAHLRHARPAPRWLEPLNRLRRACSNGLRGFVDRVYRPHLDVFLARRGLVLATAVAFLFVTAGLFAGGWVRLTFFPPIEGDEMLAAVILPEGTSVTETERALDRLHAALAELRAEVEAEQGPVFRHVHSSIGAQPGRATSGPPSPAGPTLSRGNLCEVLVELTPSADREVSALDLADRWRELTGPIPSALETVFLADRINTGAALQLELSGNDLEALQAAARAVEEQLTTYPGTFDVASDYRPGKRELHLDVLPAGTALGLRQADVARQVRQAFYGEEVQRVQLGSHDVKVFVRYPPEERRSLADLEALRIRIDDSAGAAEGIAGDGMADAAGAADAARTSGVREIPFAAVARVTPARGPATIQRLDRQRTIVVIADIQLEVANANEIRDDLEAGFLPELGRRFPGVRARFGGEQENQSETLAGLRVGMVLAMFLMFALLGVVFRSYVQPVIVLSAIPFGMAGAVWAHLLLGMDLTFMSMIGLLALMGVVVNDSLVMVDFINRLHREQGLPLIEAIRQGAPRRFRPIVLTSLTTFVGLTPILLERSLQAAFLIPMAVSLAFGVAFATLVILVFVPALTLIVEDLRHLAGSVRHPEEGAAATAGEATGEPARS